jgi:uncharacterized protein YajQ (UPF0234 family)
MSEYSFDIVSRVDKQALADAVHQAQREVSTRFDLKNSRSSLELGDETITLLADDDLKLRNVVDILHAKCAKRGVPLKALRYGKPEPAAGGTLRQTVSLVQGIDRDRAKRIADAVKAAKLRVTTQIQDQHIRVAGKSKDELQKAIALVKSLPLDIPVQFVNYR